MKKEYINLYNKITPLKSDEELLNEMLRKAENMNRGKNIRFKKPAAIICAATAALSLGITAAAATGIISFSELFGGHITTEDEEVANTLLSQPENLKWTLSDDNYEIKMNGVAGTENCVMTSFEIVRKDGKPVTDFMINKPDEGESLKSIGHEGLINDIGNGWSSHLDISVNEEGNLDFYSYINCDGYLNGSTVILNGKNFYPLFKLNQFEHENGVFAHYGDNIETGFYTFENPSVLTDLSLESEEILSLELDWSLEFTYKTSELASVEKKIEADEPEIKITMDVIRGEGFTKYPTQYKMKIIDTSFTQIGGRIITECYKSEHPYMYPETYNGEAAIIMDDGTEIPCVMYNGLGTTYHDNLCTTSFGIKYNPDIYSNFNIIDINNAVAVRICGTEFKIS